MRPLGAARGSGVVTVRSRFVSALVLAAALLAVAGVAASSATATTAHRSGPRLAPRGFARPATSSSAAASARRSLLAAGTVQLTGHVFDFSGAPLANATVTASAGSAGTGTTTDAAGAFTLSGLFAASGDGVVSVMPQDGSFFDVMLNMSWPITGMDLTLQPGHVSVSATRGGPWAADWYYVAAQAYGSGASSSLMGAQYLDPSTAGGNIDAAPMNLLPGAYTWAAVNFFTFPFSDEGVEVAGSWGVSAGVLSADTLSVAEADAQRVMVTTPFWGSGKPGATVRLTAGSFPASGWTSEFTGYPERGSASLARHYGQFPTAGIAKRSLTVPKTAPAGYDYFLDVQHVEGPLDLTTAYQVCSLNSSRTSVARGGAIRLSGRIPLAGHWGAHLAPAGKTVVIFKRTTSASQPVDWTPRGWTKVAAVKTDRTGYYHSGLLHPTRTTWYVVRYPGSISATTSAKRNSRKVSGSA